MDASTVEPVEYDPRATRGVFSMITLYDEGPSESCTTSKLSILDQANAEIFRLDPRDASCSNEFLDIAMEQSRREMCEHSEPSIADFEDMMELEEDMDSTVLVNLDLSHYQMDSRAMKKIESNIQMFTGNIRSRFSIYLARSGRYIRMMKRIMQEEGLPEDMAYLPLIESGFNTSAYSRSKAVGPWQFMEGTGKRYGLKVNWWVDERRDPVKSTRAAAKYLKELYGMFDSWSLAMCAYNAGENRIKRSLKRAGRDDIWGIMSSRYLRAETRNYVPRFIAARMIAVEPDKYGFSDVQYHDDFTYDVVVLDAPMSLDAIAAAIGVDKKTIKELNPELRRWATPPVKSYELRIPRGTRDAFIEKTKEAPRMSANIKPYVVKRGDTLSKIAARHRVPIEMLIAYNNLSTKGFIREGQTLMMPDTSE